MYQDFVQKFSANPAAVAYGNWQISQAYQATGDLQKALDYGDKALAGSPHNLDILVSLANVATAGQEQFQSDGIRRQGRGSLPIDCQATEAAKA